MTWYWQAIIGFSLFWLGYLTCALMVISRESDKIMKENNQ